MPSALRLWLLSLVALPALAQTPVSNNRPVRRSPEVRIRDEVPSYVGVWFDRDGEFHASLTNLNDSARLKVVLDSAFPNRRRDYNDPPPQKGIIIEKAKYSYADLDDWKCKIERQSINVDGFQSGGVRIQTNQVHIGVFKPEAIKNVRRIMKSFKIPSDAVRIELEEKMIWG